MPYIQDCDDSSSFVIDGWWPRPLAGDSDVRPFCAGLGGHKDLLAISADGRW